MQTISPNDKIHIIQALEPSLDSDGQRINLIIRENVTPEKVGPVSFKVGPRRFKQTDVGLTPFEGLLRSSWIIIVRADDCSLEDAKTQMQDFISRKLTARVATMKKQIERADVLLGSGMAFDTTRD